MSLDADFVYNGIRHDVSHRVAAQELRYRYVMLCERLFREQMDLELEEFTVSGEAIGPVRKAIKAMRENPSLVVWFDGGW